MWLDTVGRLTPELAGILIGFAVRHFFMPFISGKEIKDMIQYLKKHEITKEETCELRANLAQTQLWIELHEQSCPYVKKKLMTHESNF